MSKWDSSFQTAHNSSNLAKGFSKLLNVYNIQAQLSEANKIKTELITLT